jgi:methylase of polypeptide subunit release factors
MEYTTTGKNGITVFYDSWMDGGGMWFGQDYVDVITARYPNRIFDCCYEWCSGPGFIGFGLLDHGICKRLCLSDIYAPAIDRAKETILYAPNCCEDIVSAYAAESVADLPNLKQFDLVVANPPHFLECPGNDNIQRIKVDTNWQAHRDFLTNIKHHLTKDGVILLQENQAGSLNREQDFVKDIESAGLQVTAVFDSQKYYTPNDHTQIYYIELMHQ